MEVAGGCDKWSATTLDRPGTCRTSLVQLPGRPRLCDAVEGSQERLVVGPESKMAALHHDPKMPDVVEGCQQLPVESRVPALCFRQLPRVKTERPPSSFFLLLQHTADVAVRSVSGQ